LQSSAVDLSLARYYNIVVIATALPKRGIEENAKREVNGETHSMKSK